MLAAGAAERDHQVLEAAALVFVNAGIHKRHHAGQKLMHALLLVEVIDDRRIFTGELLEALFASGIRQAAAIKNESAAISAFIFRHAAVKRKRENSHSQNVGCGG